jgi:hypothetical protein
MSVSDAAGIALSAVSRLGADPLSVVLFLFVAIVMVLLWMVMTAWRSRFPPPAIPTVRPVARRKK